MQKTIKNTIILLKNIKMKFKYLLFTITIISIVISGVNFLWWDLFLWWDNSRLFIYYPELYSQFIMSGWINFSDFPLEWSYKPIYHLIFITTILGALKTLVWTYYLWLITYCGINVWGFFWIYKLLWLYSKKNNDSTLRIIVSILYICSSIVFINFNSFFAWVFLIATWPFLIFNFIKYIEEWKLLNLVSFSFITLVFWISFFIPHVALVS